MDIEEPPQNIHSLDDLKVKTREQQEAFNDHDQKTEHSKPYISSVNPNSPPNINEYDNSPTDLKNNVSNISDNSHDDFIPLDVSDSEEITMQNVNVDLLDDGRLPVTEKEEILQRKLEQKEMERNFYDVYVFNVFFCLFFFVSRLTLAIEVNYPVIMNWKWMTGRHPS